METKTVILEVAVPVPLRQTFDFIAPREANHLSARVRVKVPFGNRLLVGMVVAVKSKSEYPIERLKHAIEILDKTPVIEEALWDSLLWLSKYYLAPIGEVLDGSLPSMLRQGKNIEPMHERNWRLSEKGRSSAISDLDRAPLQLAIIKRFMKSPVLKSSDFKKESRSWYSAVSSLVQKGWIEEFEVEPYLATREGTDKKRHKLTLEQTRAVESIGKQINEKEFSCSLIHGVTGSGKTEVYFAAMRSVLDAGKRVLLLVPEIGLTPQLLKRIESTFCESTVVLHSGLNDTERHLAWWHAKQGNAQIVIGTRSAVFTQIPKLGLMIVDEEHDASFKQQDGVRYHARDFAVYRAKQANIPILLGSATPSLESYVNAKSGRYFYVQLTKRVADVPLPKVELIDLNHQSAQDGLSPAMIEAIDHSLNHGKQVMLFLNRRGYAPVHYCSSCKSPAKCHRCDSNLTVHQRAHRLRCHHCGYEGRLIYDCHQCGAKESMLEVGDGTQRVESALATRFPGASVLRIDRDNTSGKGQLAKMLEQAQCGRVDIILGTQLITKGHDFPNVGMVGILEADQGLYSTDYRASESLFQQVVQVAGRSGRREEMGRVYIQTRFPDHPFFDFVSSHDFDGFANTLISERKQAGFPPFGYFALLRAESTHQAKGLQFLRRAKADCGSHELVKIMDAVPALMERRAGRYRSQLLFMSPQRSALNQILGQWLRHIVQNKDAKRLAGSVRWSLDIDPIDLY
ncbi:MAG: primosomal protein N' [Gammaproteobacteria bacterium]|nr:primosomal protein N' [Gammaproteobacteria bacterium]